ncbi:hypothetical protein WDU94_001860 [Cyamophila willieti]
MLQSVFGTLKIHDFDSPDYLPSPPSNDTNNNTKDGDGPDIRSVTSNGSPTHLEMHKNALKLTDCLDNGAYLRLGPFNVNQTNVNIYDNYLEEMDEEENHIKENYTNSQLEQTCTPADLMQGNEKAQYVANIWRLKI